MSKKSSIQADELSPLTKNMLRALVDERPSNKGSSRKVGVSFMEPSGTLVQSEKENDAPPSLMKSILNVLDGGGVNSIERLAFEVDPSLHNQYMALWRMKQRLLPDAVLKRIVIQDDLCAAIVGTRANQMAAFGRPRADRFSMGFVIEAKAGVTDKFNEDQNEELDKRIEDLTHKLTSCGETRGWGTSDRITFANYLGMSTRDAVTVGRLATEIIYVIGSDGKKRAHSFRPIDAGTIYRATPQKAAGDAVREHAKSLLESLKNKKLVPEKFQEDEYAFVQVIDGKPMQAFTEKECLVHNFYPVTNVELDGYPLTPIDTAISAVTTHINIRTHNKMYFQSGRAARGMLVIKSDEMNEKVISRIRQQFNASINGVNNAWRMPVFGVGSEDDLTWAPIDSGSRDMEFQYLADDNARVILAAFQIGPEEVPGYQHLSRGTNNQALAESNNEWKLQAARDVGIRPLIKSWEDFLNSAILPLFDPVLAKSVQIRFVGLDAETAEKESVRIQQDMPVHMTIDRVMEHVELDPIGKIWGGDFLINPSWQQILDNHSGLMVGEIAAHFFGRPELKDRPDLQYVRDPMWFQFQDLLLQQQQAQAQAQQTQQPPGGGGDSGGGGQAPAGPGDGGQQGDQQPTKESDLSRSIDQAIGALTKGEEQLPPSKRRLLLQHKKTLDHFLAGWEADVAEATTEILKVAGRAKKN